MGFRIEESDPLEDTLLVLLAAGTTKTPLIISIAPNDTKLQTIESAIVKIEVASIKKQSTDAFITEMEHYERVRTCSTCLPDTFYEKAATLGKHIADNKPLAEGRLELLHYLKEQSIAYEYHRYGSIFER